MKEKIIDNIRRRMGEPIVYHFTDDDYERLYESAKITSLENYIFPSDEARDRHIYVQMSQDARKELELRLSYPLDIMKPKPIKI